MEVSTNAPLCLLAYANVCWHIHGICHVVAAPGSLGFHLKSVFLPGLFWQSPKRPPFPVKFEFNDPL